MGNRGFEDGWRLPGTCTLNEAPGVKGVLHVAMSRYILTSIDFILKDIVHHVLLLTGKSIYPQEVHFEEGVAASRHQGACSFPLILRKTLPFRWFCSVVEDEGVIDCEVTACTVEHVAVNMGPDIKYNGTGGENVVYMGFSFFLGADEAWVRVSVINF